MTLTLGYPFPAKHPLRLQVLEPWAADVLAATDGAVTIEFHADQALSPAAETYSNVVEGRPGYRMGATGICAGALSDNRGYRDAVRLQQLFTGHRDALGSVRRIRATAERI